MPVTRWVRRGSEGSGRMMNSSMAESLIRPHPIRQASCAEIYDLAVSDHFKQKMARHADHRCCDHGDCGIPLRHRPSCPILHETVHFNAPDTLVLVLHHDHTQEIKVPIGKIPQIPATVG